MPRPAVVSMFFSVVFFTCFVSAQNQPPASNSQAVAYSTQSMAAITGGARISDVTLTGSVTWNGGETDTGAATLRALGTGESRMDLALSSGTRTEIRDAQTGTPVGRWINPNNVSGAFALQNCQTDAVWFFPALGSLALGPNVVLSYVGQETRNGATVQHIQAYGYQAGQTSTGGVNPQQLSTTDFYLDATTLLPIAITFDTHPDNNAATDLLVEIDFSNYQTISGVAVPMHIQRYLQGNLMVNLVLSAASFNTGLPLSIFTIN
jgi:hypothetical protein